MPHEKRRSALNAHQRSVLAVALNADLHHPVDQALLEAVGVEADVAGVTDQRGLGEIVLVLIELALRFPELALLGRTLTRFRCSLRIRMNFEQRVLAKDESYPAAVLIQHLLHD